MGSLSVYKTSFSDGGNQIVWTQSGDKGRFWLRTYMEIKSTTPFKVFFSKLFINKIN
jgi:hypothetical protein